MLPAQLVLCVELGVPACGIHEDGAPQGEEWTLVGQSHRPHVLSPDDAYFPNPSACRLHPNWREPWHSFQSPGLCIFPRPLLFLPKSRPRGPPLRIHPARAALNKTESNTGPLRRSGKDAHRLYRGGGAGPGAGQGDLSDYYLLGPCIRGDPLDYYFLGSWSPVPGTWAWARRW
eukprot:gene7888-biopygen13623